MGGPIIGDRVRITAATPEGPVTHEGILLSPATEGHMTVKLDNGYNVTLAETEISDISTKPLLLNHEAADIVSFSPRLDSIEAASGESAPFLRTFSNFTSFIDKSTIRDR